MNAYLGLVFLLTLLLPDGVWGQELKLEKLLQGHSSLVNSIVFSPNGQLLASGSSDKTIRLWQVSSGQVAKAFESEKGGVECMAFSPNGDLLASSNIFGTIQLWQLSNGQVIQTLEGSRGFTSIAFSPDGRFLVSGGLDKTVRLWEVAKGQLVKSLKVGKSTILGVAFSPDSRFIASSIADSSASSAISYINIKLWDISTSQEVQTFKSGNRASTGVAFSPDGRFLASGSNDGIVTIWSVSSGNIVQTFKDLNSYSNTVTSVAFNPDGRFLATGNWDKTVKLWQVNGGQLVQTFYGHTKVVNSVAFSPDSRFVASVDWDKTICILSTGLSISSDSTAKVDPFTRHLIDQKPVTISQSPEVDLPTTVISPSPTFAALTWIRPNPLENPGQPYIATEPTLQLKATITARTNEATVRRGLKVYVNNKVVEGDKMGEVSLVQQEQEFFVSRSVNLSEGKNTIRWGLTLPGQAEVSSRPLDVNYTAASRLVLLSVGINRDLKFPAIDAQQIRDAWKKQQGGLFETVETEVLTSESQTTANAIRGQLVRLRYRNLRPEDLLIVFISAHGKKIFVSDETDFGILASDYDGAYPQTEQLTVLPFKAAVLDYLKAVPCKKLILFDACHSGQAVLLAGSKDDYLKDLAEARSELRNLPPGIALLSSSRDNELSYEDSSWGNGAFTKALLNGLNGKADTDNNGIIYLNELYTYLKATVPDMVQRVKSQSQVPVLQNTIGKDFPIFRYRH